ncbi:1,2-dihydroxy-3-keto-5-methylthiopentene dioxygenase [Streptomyces tubercidicus]|uniref:Acireductone dioxygenase n=1 Tax=Streptomyces tubercidicus TaxID=47759 RepID=A0A640UKA2_9ACTN|nr:cupin [Streptomyces tubercidicus]WAU10635.1 cupin [Streptomyces tubercidicus]GFE35762.1 acireductone dioxygenase [Streptomyces tubercidicus]
MTLLTTWPESGPGTVIRRTTDPGEIAAVLAPIGVRYEQWPLRDHVPEDPEPEAVLRAYREEVKGLVAAEGFATVDAVGLRPRKDLGWRLAAKAERKKFLSEHTHDDDDEVRFFVAGAGAFYLHVDREVHAVLCEAGDLLKVPRGTKHWFDMGASPSFTVIRFFHEENGWVGNFTGSDIALKFPDFDALMAARAAA